MSLVLTGGEGVIEFAAGARGGHVTDEIATIGRDIDLWSYIYAGHLSNPDPTLIAKGGGLGERAYDEVLRDTHAGSVLRTRFTALSGSEWEVDPASDSRKDRKAAELITNALLGSNFSTLVSDLVRGVLYGHAEAEIMWEAREGQWLPARFIGKHPHRFVFTDERELRLLTPENMIDGIEIPKRKFISFTWGDSDNPYGFGLGQGLWWWIWFKKNGIKFWLTFLERFGQPTVVGSYPPGSHPDQQKKLLDAIKALQNETGVKIPDNMKLSLLEASRQGKSSYEEFCNYADSQISKAVLGQTLTTQVGNEGGSYAAAKVHSEIRQDILKNDGDLLAERLNETIVRWIVDYNMAGVGYPKLWFKTEPPEDLKLRADILKILSVDMKLPIGTAQVYEEFDVQEPEPGDAVLGPAAVDPEPPPDGHKLDGGSDAGVDVSGDDTEEDVLE